MKLRNCHLPRRAHTTQHFFHTGDRVRVLPGHALLRFQCAAAMAALNASMFKKETVPVGSREASKASTASPSVLTTAEVADYTKDVLMKHVRGIKHGSIPVDAGKPLVASEIHGSNMNYAWKVCEADRPDGGAIFVKQAPGYIKVLGEGYKLSAERLLVEVQAMEEYGGPLPFGGIWKGAAPAYVPTLYFRDSERCIMVTEFLVGHTLMRDVLRRGECAPSAAVDVANFMALTHARTHKACAPAGSTPRCSTLTNAPMCAITADYVFSKPMDANDQTNRSSPGIASDAAALRRDRDVVAGVKKLREAFLTKKECLVHGDLHTGSIMVTTPGAVDVTYGGAGGRGASAAAAKAKIIDAEFAHYGCAAFDVGTFLANVIFGALACDATANGGGPAALAMMDTTWNTYTAAMNAVQPSPLSTPAAQADLLQLTAGFAGCELIRRVIGAAHVEDIEEIDTPARKTHAEKAALAIGGELVRKHASFRSFGDVVSAVRSRM